MALNQGQNGTMSTVSFQITSLNQLNGNFYALSTVGGPAATNPMLGSYFDWGCVLLRPLRLRSHQRQAGGWHARPLQRLISS